MARSETHYLRLVETPGPDDVDPEVSDHHGILLGFVDMSRASDVALETILSRVQPAWVFDLRPVPYFNIGRLNRRRMFELLRTWSAAYRDVAGALGITEYNDASLNSGAVGSFLNQTIAECPLHAPIVVLVDHADALVHAMSVLPRSLRSSLASSWCAMALDVEVHGGDPDLFLRTPRGDTYPLDMRWLDDSRTR
jgi:hypothetical protein